MESSRPLFTDYWNLANMQFPQIIFTQNKKKIYLRQEYRDNNNNNKIKYPPSVMIGIEPSHRALQWWIMMMMCRLSVGGWCYSTLFPRFSDFGNIRIQADSSWNTNETEVLNGVYRVSLEANEYLYNKKLKKRLTISIVLKSTVHDHPSIRKDL